MRPPALVVMAMAFIAARSAAAQQPLHRAEAIAAAEAHGPRAALARADTAIGVATLAGARIFENPLVSAGYSKSVPQYHASLDLPLDFLVVRGARIASARDVLVSVRFRLAFERAAAGFDADTAYTRALAAAARARLSRRNEAAADTLLHVATVRRDAGDASDLDVELAAVTAGQASNAAAADSLAAVDAVLVLQEIMGMPSDRPEVVPADSLGVPPVEVPPADSGTPVRVAAFAAALSAQEHAIALARHGRYGAPSVSVGFETGDPSGGETGVLPTVGFSIPLPLLNRNGAGIALALANRDRAAAELATARRESSASIARALRDQASASERIARGRVVVRSAERVAALSLTAYREGAIALPAVLEAQRTARETLAQYIDDLAAANVAAAAVRLFSLTAASPR